MTIKVTRTTVLFNGPFSLRNVEGIQPAEQAIEVDARRHRRQFTRRGVRVKMPVPALASNRRKAVRPPSYRTPKVRTASAAAEVRFSTPSLA